MSRAVVYQAWADTPHLDAAAQAALLDTYPLHERDARTKGIPQLGAGAIYPVPESEICCEPFEIPSWFPRCYGLDVGWNRTAAVWGALDRDTDVAYLYAEHYRGHAEPSIHAAAIRARGEWMHGVIDPASRGRGQADGEQLLANYIELGLRLTCAENGREAGIFDVFQRLSTGRLKVFKTLVNWLREYRFYQRDEKGNVVKKDDHLMDATRYLVVSGLQNAVLAPDYLERAGHGRGRVVSDYNPLEAA
jgi:Terminase RNaseH-like domain